MKKFFVGMFILMFCSMAIAGQKGIGQGNNLALHDHTGVNQGGTVAISGLTGSLNLSTKITGSLDLSTYSTGSIPVTRITGSLDLSTQVTGSLNLSTFSTGSINGNMITGGTLTNSVKHSLHAFKAKNYVTEVLADNILTKLSFTSEDYDIYSDYDAPNSKFTPNESGYYLIGVQCPVVSADPISYSLHLYKNNAVYITNQVKASSYPTVYFLEYTTNGTDYYEVYAQIDVSSGSSTMASGATSQCKFWASKIF